jgi:putative membrane protein
MIVQRHLNFLKTLPYVHVELVIGAVVSVIVYLVYDVGNVTQFSIPNVLPTLLGSALAIFLAFRNTASYARWGEAAQAWSSIASNSRVLARVIITFVQAHNHTPTYNDEFAQTYKREMVYRQIAWVNALRLHLRGESKWEILQPFLSENEWNIVMTKQNKPLALLLLQGHGIYDAMRNGTLQGFDSMQMEVCMGQFTAIQAQCERIKSIPIPRHYRFFTRLFVWFFIVVVPFCFVQPFAATSRTWVIIPVTVLLSYVFGSIERTGAVNEEPFDNRVTDVPLTAFCVDIERDLREMLGETEIPEKLEPKNGYLL